MSDRPRVLMVHDYPPYTGGGLALAVQDLMVLLGDRYDFEVLSSRLKDHCTDDRGNGDGASPRRGSWLLRLWPAVRRADVIVTHWTFSCRSLATAILLARPLLRTPTVCVVHTAPEHCAYGRLRVLPPPLRRMLIRLIGRAMRHCSAVVALSASHAGALRQAGLPVTVVAPMPVLRRTADAAPSRGRGRVVGVVGEISTIKGSDALPSIARALTPRFALRIAGSGPLERWLACRLAELDPQQRAAVDLCGWLPPTRLADFYAGVDYLLIPSRTESQCRVAIEAMRAGVIVVARPATGIVDLITHGVTGVLAQPADVAAALDELSADPERAARIRARAAARAAAVCAHGRRSWRALLDDVALDGSCRPSSTVAVPEGRREG